MEMPNTCATVFQIYRHEVSTDNRNMPKSQKLLSFNFEKKHQY